MVRTFGTEPDPGKRIRQRQGKAIRDTRKMKGITPAGLAEEVGVTEAAVGHWERGYWSPKQAHQVAIAQALDVPWSLLFGLDGEVA